jgi:NAD(P)-dependent dehydrogenase (short-subunit alcohol dehydrogenase family)
MPSTLQTPAIALVTGAADRIGAAIALALGTAGYRVLVHYRSSADAAENVVSSIRSSGGKAQAISADLCSRKERQSLVARAGDVFGPLTLLVNNASLFDPDSALDLTEELWDQHFGVHAEAPVFLARDFAAQLPEGQQGSIVNIIDERVLHLTPAYFSYTLSKAALWNATRLLAQSLAPRIRVNAIGPGPTLRNSRQSEADFQASIDALLLRRGASPEEIADAVLFLARSPAVTGQLLALDGGEHLEFMPERGPTPREK